MIQLFGAILLLGCIFGVIILFAVVYQTMNARRQYDNTIRGKDTERNR